MSVRTFVVRAVLIVGLVGVCSVPPSLGQESAPTAEPPPVPKGVEVLARGPIHEAFATPTTEPVPTKIVPKRPPKAIDEMPPEQKPDGEVAWIGGYWAWDDERNDYLWVSGMWRTPPPGRTWVAGYWKEVEGGVQWVPGFWTAAAQQEQGSQEITYLPAPPVVPEVAAPGEPPTAESFYVPGVWEWRGGRYFWRAGYWARVEPGYVWVAAHYVWTPSGYVHVAGYWDLAISRRGVLFAPVVVDTAVVGPAFVYTPSYVVCDTVVIDSLWVRPCYRHYYFGDYYGVTYREYGFESCAVYSRGHYDAIFVYERWEHRAEPSWFSIQIGVYNDRCAGRVPCPPRTLVQQNTIIQQNITNVTNVTNVKNVTNNVTNVTNNTTNINRTTVNTNTVLMPATQMAAAKNGAVRTVAVDNATRVQAKQQAQALQQVTAQRTQAETPAPGGRPVQARAVSLNVPKTKPVGPPSTTTSRPGISTNAASNARTATPTSRAIQPGPVTTNPPSNPRQPAVTGASPGTQPAVTGRSPAAGANGPPKSPVQRPLPVQPAGPRPGATPPSGQPPRPGQPGTNRPQPRPQPPAKPEPPGKKRPAGKDQP